VVSLTLFLPKSAQHLRYFFTIFTDFRGCFMGHDYEI